MTMCLPWIDFFFNHLMNEVIITFARSIMGHVDSFGMLDMTKIFLMCFLISLCVSMMYL